MDSGKASLVKGGKLVKYCDNLSDYRFFLSFFFFSNSEGRKLYTTRRISRTKISTRLSASSVQIYLYNCTFSHEFKISLVIFCFFKVQSLLKNERTTIPRVVRKVSRHGGEIYRAPQTSPSPNIYRTRLTENWKHTSEEVKTRRLDPFNLTNN